MSGSLNTSVYTCRKLTHTNQYRNFASKLSLSTRIGVARTCLTRASNTVKDQDQLRTKQKHITGCPVAL